MKKYFKLLLLLIVEFPLTNNFVNANIIKSPENVFEKEGNIYINYNDKSSSRVTNLNTDYSPQLSSDKKFIVFFRKILPEKRITEDNMDDRNPVILIYYSISTKSERTLAKSCNSTNQIADNYSTTTKEYPDKVLCSFSDLKIAPDNQRVYFESFNGIAGSGNTIFVDLKSFDIHYFAYGHLLSIETNQTLKLVVSKIETINGVSQGRRWDTWLYDINGNPIKLLIKDMGEDEDFPTTISAVELVKKFYINEKIANQHYLNKFVDISGKILSVKKDYEGHSIIVLKGNEQGTDVYITMSTNNISSQLSNKSISIRAKVNGILSDLILINGIIIKVY